MLSLDSQDTSLFRNPFCSSQNVVPLKMTHDVTVDYVFHYLTRNSGKANWSVI